MMTLRQFQRQGRRIGVDGSPAIPVMGEAHFSRIPRELWPMVVGHLRSLGVTLVSSYLMWNQHQPDPEQSPSFAGHLDLASFVDLVHGAGMDFCLRIGPWVHGESRYGGFPDWVATGPWRCRTNDPGYLAVVNPWFASIAAHLGHRRPAVLQVENELYDQPEHLLRLKQLAAGVGIVADLTTATAWGGADFDREEFIPVYGGYPDTFWSPHSLGWEPRCGIHYRFQPVRDDALVGEDGRSNEAQTPVDDSQQPYATCELGAGMATSYHRRPQISGADVGALGITKIGCGSVWQGWYLMAGGLNPVSGSQPLHESKETGYPNDLPLRDYDFGAPIGAAGQLRPSAAPLRQQHALLALLGPSLAESSVDFGQGPLRHSIRSWPSDAGLSALVLFNNHEPGSSLAPVEAAQIEVPGIGPVPPQPVRVGSGEYGAWAANLNLGGGICLRSSNLMPLARLGSAQSPLWVFAQTIAASATAEFQIEARTEFVEFTQRVPLTPLSLRSGTDEVKVVVLRTEELESAWLLGGRLLLSKAPLIESDGELFAVCDPDSSGTSVRVVDGDAVTELARCPSVAAVNLAMAAALGPPAVANPVLAPGDFSAAQPLRIVIPESASDVDRLRIRWRGNVLRVVVAGHAPEDLGRVLADQFWHGEQGLVISVAHLRGHREIDLFIADFDASEQQLVTGQGGPMGVTEVTWLPVVLHPLLEQEPRIPQETGNDAHERN